jgi:hypothetical protein
LRQRNAARLLVESREVLETTVPASKTTETPVQQPKEETFAATAPLSSISAPPPITTVLHDLYQEETSANN